MIYNKMLRPLIFSRWKDPEDAHEFVMHNLERVQKNGLLLAALTAATRVRGAGLERELLGLKFPNPVGLGGGFDKNARAIRGLEALGFGFIEIGTVTWHPQPGNPRPRVFRFEKDGALINRFGFNNDGARAVAERLAGDTKPRLAPLGVSLGKSKITELKDAVEDYLQSLRELQDKSALDDLLAALDDEGKVLSRKAGNGDKEEAGGQAPRLRKPILVKIAPDLEPQALDELLQVCVNRNVDGLIATNTTLSRDGLNVPTEEAGGLSGKPLFPRSLAIVRHIRKQLPEMPIIGVGGIMTPDDAWSMLEAGANLLQVYTGLIYEGPMFARQLKQGIVQRMAASAT